MSRASRAEQYRNGARKGADDRKRGRSVGDWSTDERRERKWGFPGWRGYWDAHDDPEVDIDARAEMSLFKEIGRAALGLAIGLPVLLRHRRRLRKR
jgi:hypothetical protein